MENRRDDDQLALLPAEEELADFGIVVTERDGDPILTSNPKPENCPDCSSALCIGSACQFPSLEEAQRIPRISLRGRRAGQGPRLSPDDSDASSPSLVKEAAKSIPFSSSSHQAEQPSGSGSSSNQVKEAEKATTLPSPSAPILMPQALPTSSSSHLAEQPFDPSSNEELEEIVRQILNGNGS